MEKDYINLRNTLVDEESKIIFDARIAYMQTGDTFAFIKKMHDLYKDFQYPVLDRFIEGKDEKEISFVIFSDDYEDEIAFEILKHTKYASCIYGFCKDNKDLWGKTKHNLPIISIYDLLAKNKDFIYILASVKYNYHFLYQLLSLGVPHKNIFIAQYGGFFPAERGWQYFDVFQPDNHEIFIDAGAYDGITSKNFLDWCHGEYDSIYMFELNRHMKSICLNNLTMHENINFIGKGVWNQNTHLEFADSQNSSYLIETSCNTASSNQVEACSIDSELEGKKVTFIKMDVEGSELRALIGARKTIKISKPKLAISVYHKLDDIINIMNYLIALNPEYKFYIRHYSACQWETVLYAV